MHPYLFEQQRANEHWEALVADAQRRHRAKEAKQGRRDASRRRRSVRLLHLW